MERSNQRFKSFVDRSHVEKTSRFEMKKSMQRNSFEISNCGFVESLFTLKKSKEPPRRYGTERAAAAPLEKDVSALR